MYCKTGFISFLFFSFLIRNIIAQVSIPFSPDCEKPIEFLQKNCYYCGETYGEGTCVLEKFSYLGETGNKQYYYGAYKLDNRKIPQLKIYKLYWDRFFIIYEGDKHNSKLKPIHYFNPRYDFDYYDCELAKTKYGTIIHIQIVEDAAGWDDGEYIIYRNGKWEKLREPNWFCAAEGLLPEGYNLDFHSSDSWLKINLKTMSIKIPVEKNYEPTGGFVIFNLAVEKDRFGIMDSKYIPGSTGKNKVSKTGTESFSYCEISIDFLQNNCYTCGDSSKDVNCKDMEFQYLGDDNGKQYYYGLYLLMNKNNDYDSSYFVVYEGKKGEKKLKPVHFLSLGGRYSYNVEMTDTKYGLIIHIELVSGNGNWDFGEYIIYRNGKWKKLKVPDWNCVYEWIIPEDTWFCKGNVINLNEMKNTFLVYSYDDACCCPSKGIVISKLTIDDNGFRVLSSKYYPDIKW